MVKGRAKRTTYIYALKNGPRIVQYGITDNPDERLIAHENSRKRFNICRLFVVQCHESKRNNLKGFTSENISVNMKEDHSSITSVKLIKI